VKKSRSGDSLRFSSAPGRREQAYISQEVIMKKWFLRFALVALLGLVLFVGVAFLRLQLAENEVRQEQQALSAAAPLPIGETKTLEILPLYEAAGRSDLVTGPGVAYLIRTDSATILFDLGNNLDAASPSPLEENMARLGIARNEIDLIVLSHRHPDHVGGQNWWLDNTFSLDGTSQPPLGDLPVYIPEAMTYPGSILTLAAAPTGVAEGVATTGLIGYTQPFPIWLAMPKGDEQALAINVAGQGIVLVTGCGHTGMKRLLERAETAFGQPVIGVVGGLHYGNADGAALQPQIEMLQGLNPAIVALSPHDSGPAALEAFAQAFAGVYQPIGVGAAIALPQPVAQQ
jgi:7,8-dihydropterin-6-yl-methyl-4-(beta-D-ribofuranosyl)aminobenzene 5'-phosphate synthase